MAVLLLCGALALFHFWPWSSLGCLMCLPILPLVWLACRCIPGTALRTGMVLLCTTLVAIAAVAVALWRTSFSTRIQNAGGFAKLRLECRSLFDDPRMLDTGYWPREEALPPITAVLHPQFVRMHREDRVSFMDIQTSGGFLHAGLLVAVDPVPANYLPHQPHFRVREIADGVFEYRE